MMIVMLGVVLEACVASSMGNDVGAKHVVDVQAKDCRSKSRSTTYRLAWFFTEFKCKVQMTWASEVCLTADGREAVTTLQVKIQPDGSLRDVKIAQSSGRASEDEAALEAVIKAAPFSVPPAQLIEGDGTVNFRFRFQCSGLAIDSLVTKRIDQP